MWRRINEMRAFHDLQEPSGWQLRKVDAWVAECRKDITRWKAYRAEVEAGVDIKRPDAIPGIVARTDETIHDLKEEIVVLCHLGKHLERTVAVLPTGRKGRRK